MPSPAHRGRPPHDDVLTPAEWRVVHAVRHGLSNRQIAVRRGISVDAVKQHVANAVAKLGVADRKGLRRWSGAPKRSALRSQEQAMETTLRLGPIGQVSRTVSDIAAAQSWYGKVLGLKHLYTFGKAAFFDCGGTRLYLTAECAAAPESILYLRVADIRAAYQELQSRGVEFTGAPHLIHTHADGTEEWMAFFKDPDGRPLALISQPKP
ncbi:MAG TPA: VOC family protein [Steroidobacteraceae bacterium]|jgi:DNA-binding CsgD family transcriptional regulator/catechol 2,3-dioxygenase-like lactoylglutathione lyase family enzyme|nr:VOC family protein [Steroidobacteraceae bacterium]